MLHNWNTRLKQFTDQQKKGLKSDLNNLQNRWKELKMYWKVEIELSINDSTKSSQIYRCKPFFSFQACQKKIVEFTDLTLTIYWPAKTDKKDNLDHLSIYVSTKYIPDNVCDLDTSKM